MSTGRILRVPEEVREREGEQIDAHALGITLISAPETDMKRFEFMEKERLVERHAAEVAALTQEIAGLRTQVSGLGEQIRSRAKRENNLMLAMGALALLVAYFYFRDYGCGAPLWTRMWGS